MSEHELEPLSDAIVELLQRERDAYPDDAASKAAVLARVELAVAVAGAQAGAGDGGGRAASRPAQDADARPVASANGAGAAAARGAGTFALGARGAAALAIGSLLAGAAAGALAENAAHPREPVVVAPPPSASAPTDPPARPASGPTDAPGITVDALPSAPPQPSTVSRPAADGLTRERELLDVARASLARGNPEGALAALRRHAERWPNGQLADEREVVWIQALVAEGHGAQAERRAERFRRAHPSSLLLGAVDAALRARPDGGSP